MSLRDHHYRAHGLAIRSDLVLPEMAAAPALADGRPDLVVSTVSSPDTQRAHWLARPRLAVIRDDDALLFRTPDDASVMDIPGVATFRVQAGQTIRIAPHPNADPGRISLFALGSAMGIALMQRGALVLHAAAVVIQGRATLFAGPSGSGKSTLAARLAQTGMLALGDDTIAVWPTGEPRGFSVYPAASAFKLSCDTIAAIGEQTGTGCRVANGTEKFYVANPRPALDQPFPLGDIHVLLRGDAGALALQEELPILQAVKDLTDNLYRPQIVDALGLTDATFRLLCRCADQSRVWRLRRPWSLQDDGGLIDLLCRGGGGDPARSGTGSAP